jgi:hypothetical protein
MAEVNREALGALTAPTNGDDPKLRTIDYSPPLDLRLLARNLGAFALDTTVGRFDPERITMRQRAQMRRDPMIALGLHFRKSTLINAPWHVECDDPQIAAFVERALRDIYPRLLSQMMMALEWGYQPIVKRFKRVAPRWTYEDPKDHSVKRVWPDGIQAVVWDDFRTIYPDGAEVTLSADGRTFRGFKHNLLTSRDGKQIVVPATHALWVTYGFDDNFGDWYGYPLTGYAFRYWWSYWYQWLLADRHMEQDADPPVKASYPPGSSADPDDPSKTIPNINVAMKAGQMLRDGATVAVPSDFWEVDAQGTLARGMRKWDIEFIRGGENIKAFHDSFAYLDVMKLRSVLVPDQALTGARGSLSGNVAETYSIAFAESQAIIAQWLDQHINDYMIPDLVAQNFVDPPECKKVTERFRDEDLQLLNRLLEIVAASDPSALQIDWRTAVQGFNMPTLDPEEVERIKKEKEAEAKALADASGRGTQRTANAGNDNPARTRIADARDNAAQ